jgi:hypothetical protein
MNALIAFIGSHATKILGGLITSLSFLTGAGVIPNSQLKYYAATIGLLTIWRGIFSGNAYDRGVQDGLSGPLALPPFPTPKVSP